MTLDQHECAVAGGGYRSSCGVQFIPAAMAAPPGARCHRCDLLHRDQRRAVRPPAGLLRRLGALLVGRPT